EAVTLAFRLRPDVVLMDLRMPGRDGVAATADIMAAVPSTRVLVLTSYGTDADIVRAIDAGAFDYILKDAPPAKLVAAIRTAAAARTSAVGRLARRPKATTPVDTLSQREIDVLRLVAGGLSNAEIGRELFIAEATVKTHLLRTFAKLGVSDRT